MKSGGSWRHTGAGAALPRPWVGLLLACACGLLKAEPVVNPALAPVDLSKLLQTPSASMGPAGAATLTENRLLGPRGEPVLGSGSSGVSLLTKDANWQAAAGEVLGAAAADTRARPGAVPAGRADPARPGADRGDPGRAGSLDQSEPQAARARPERWQGDQPNLFSEALKSMHDGEELRDIKNLWHEASGELKQFRGGLLFDAPSEEELAQRRSARQRAEGYENGSLGGGGGSSSDPGERPRTAAEQQRDSILASVMLKKMIDEILPWLIGLGVSLGLARVGLSIWRLQARQKAEARSRKSSQRRRSSSRSRAI